MFSRARSHFFNLLLYQLTFSTMCVIIEFAIFCACLISNFVFSNAYFLNKSVSQILIVPNNASNFKTPIYASAFKAEIYALGLDTHLFQTDEIEAPGEEERNIAITAGILCYKLRFLPIVSQIALEVSAHTAYIYLDAIDKKNLYIYLFDKLDERLKADKTLGKYYEGMKSVVQRSSHFSLEFADIDLDKLSILEDKIQERVWKNSTFFGIVGRERFLQYAQTSLENTENKNLDYVDDARLILELGSGLSNVSIKTEGAFELAMMYAISESRNTLQEAKYDNFDRSLFTLLSVFIKKDPELDEAIASMKKLHPEHLHAF